MLLRKDNSVFVYGKYTLLDKNNHNVYAYTREEDGEKMLVLLNFSGTNAPAKIGINLQKAEVLLSNYKRAPVTKMQAFVTLTPYEAVVYRVRE